MVINFRKVGIIIFKIFEKLDNVGGIWYDNIYFSCGCDILFILYLFFFEFKSDWM